MLTSTFRWSSGVGGLDHSLLPRWFLQWLIGWICPQPGGFILSFMYLIWRGTTSRRSLKGWSDHLHPLWSMVKRSLRWRWFWDIRALAPSVSIRCCGKVIPSLRLLGSLNRISAMLLRSWRNICAASQQRRQYISDSKIEAAGRLLVGVLEDLPGCCRSSGWVQLAMGHHVWREIVFGMPSLCLWPKDCSCADDCRIQNYPIVGAGTGSPMVIGLIHY